MPYSNMPEELWEKMDACVEKVQAQGKSKESAIAICYDSVMERSRSMNRGSARRATRGRRDIDGDHPAGQLCPYQDDCAHDLAIPNEGWYRCGNCKREFYARDSDSDFEDYACYRREQAIEYGYGEPPSEVPTARDLGSSWATPKEKRMNSLQQLWINIKHAFTDAGLIEETLDAAPPARTRAVPAQMILNQIYDALRAKNQAALKVDERGEVYLDWTEYLNLFDIYYDDGDLFAVVTRGGKLYRIPIAVTGDAVTLGEMVEIPLTRTAVASQFRVIRTADGKRKWFGIAASSVLNRVNEIDSKKLFDSFVEHATRTGEYPVLSFYHAAGIIRWGVATMIARDGDLYIAAGDWYDTPEAQRAADAFERSEKNWGLSIGYESTKPPEWLELAREIHIPVFTEGVNREISIVLENEAAAYLTAFRTREVIVSKDDLAYRRLVETFGEEEAERQLAAVNGAQRVIEETNPIRRAQEQPPAEVAPTPDAAADKPTAEATAEADASAPAQTTATESSPPAPTQATESAPAPTRARETVLEWSDETLAQVKEMILAQPEIQRAMSDDDMKAMREQMEKMKKMMSDMQEKLDGAMERALKAEQRLALLEREDAEKQRAWLADLPAPQRVSVVVRPRDKRAPQEEQDANANGKPKTAAPRGAALY